MTGIEKKIRLGVLVGTAQDWTTANLVIRTGEIGFEKDTYKSKMGDGISSWNSLPYLGIAASLSQPPEGHHKVVNMYVNAETGRLEVEYEILGG